jgi:hypothetical protein
MKKKKTHGWSVAPKIPVGGGRSGVATTTHKASHPRSQIGVAYTPPQTRRGWCDHHRLHIWAGQWVAGQPVKGLTFLFCFLIKKKRVITFYPHELPACVILSPRTITSTKKEHQTTIFTKKGRSM